MHDRQTEILCTLERIERLLMKLCNNTTRDGTYLFTTTTSPTTGVTVKPSFSDYHSVTGTDVKP